MSVQSELNRIRNNIEDTYSALEELGASTPAVANSNSLSTTVSTVKAVLYGKDQELTDNQKARARANISASSIESNRVALVLASESGFKAEALYKSINHGLDDLFIENYEDTEDIDLTRDDGEEVITEFYSDDAHYINKTTSGIKTIQSKKFTVSDTAHSAFVYADYDGTGSITIYLSKDDGTNWKQLNHDSMTTLDNNPNNGLRIRIALDGKVRLKNIAWGIK